MFHGGKKPPHLKYHIKVFVNLDSSPFITTDKNEYNTSDGTEEMNIRGFTSPWRNKVLSGYCFLSHM